MPAPVLQFKRGNAGVAGTVPALRPGEPAISLNNFDFFIGIDTSVANNKFFGSHRYWGREDGTNSLRFKLVDKDGSNYIGLKAPNTLAGIVTYVLPGTQGGSSSVLTNDGSGNLTWASGSANPVFTGIATFSDTTDNTLGDPNTGAVQINGGLGIDKNVTVGGNLNVQGYSEFVGVVTFKSGTINLGDADTDDINVAGEFISNLVPNTSNTYDLGTTSKRWRNGYYSGNVDIVGTLNVDGNVTIGGTSITLLGQDVYIENKDIILGFTTSIIPNEDTANHAGVAIASTVGTPLVSFSVSGINTLPDTYKQMMWFHSGTLGFSTDAFAFNYGVAIGTTNMANGVRLAVGSNVTVTDTTVNATTGNFTNLTGTLAGTISTATRSTIVDTTGTSTNADYFVTFVDTLAGQNGETVRVGSGLSVNPSTGDVKAAGSLSIGSPSAVNAYLKSGGGSNALYLFSNGDVSFQAKAVVNEIRSSSNSSTLITLNDLDATFARNVKITGITTVGTGVGITQFSSSVSTGTSTSSVPTSSAIIDYIGTQIGNVDLTTSIAGDSGTGSVNTSQTLTIAGTASEIETSASGQTITIGLPNTVVVGTSLSSPTVKANIIQSQDTSTTAITITGNDVTFADDVTVTGNLYVNGSTTQVNTSAITVEDRTIELGVVNGSAPTSTTTWDLGVLFNYYDGSAKKSALIWEQSDSRFKLGSVISDGGGTGNDNPQITFTTFAPIEIGALWVTDCAGTSQVISCTGSTRHLENITIDAGTF
jgi:hypothetical protein